LSLYTFSKVVFSLYTFVWRSLGCCCCMTGRETFRYLYIIRERYTHTLISLDSPLLERAQFFFFFWVLGPPWVRAARRQRLFLFFYFPSSSSSLIWEMTGL
jgi:hypothetical protein